MPFANLPSREKDAFFSLLDEYFASRPEIFGAQGQGQGQQRGQQDPVQEATTHAASAMKRAMVNNPEATAKVFSAGLRHAASSASSTPPKRGSPGIGGAGAVEQEGESIQTSVANRIAAFSSSRNNAPPAAASAGSGTSSSASRRFGDVDTSSAKGFISSLRGGSGNNNNSAPAATPFAAPPKASGFGLPPPTRRFGGAGAAANEDTPAPPAPPPPPPPPMRGAAAQQEEEEARGEWAEALYDYASPESGDLNIKEGQRILVTERSSDDWWTGEIDGNGKPGLFPASYAKLL